MRNNHSKAVNVESISYSIDKPMDTIPNSVIVNSTFVPLDAFNNFTGGFANHYVFGQYGVGSGEMFCDGLESTELEHFPHLGIDSVYLKLLVNVTYEGEKSDGSPHEYTYMFTYKVDDIDIDEDNPLYPNLPGSAGDITQYPENLYLKDETFDGSPVEGCQLNGDIYTCKAWNDITVEGEFTVVPNYKVKVEAGNELDIIPEAVTPPEMQFSIVPVLDYSNPMPPVDEDYVTTFCEDTIRYQARGASKSLGKMGSESDDEKSFFPTESETEFAFNIYPNPTSGSTTVSITLEEAAQGELFITDINGRRLESAFDNRRLGIGQSEHQLPTQTLSPGIYLVHLFVNGEHHVKRLVKQ